MSAIPQLLTSHCQWKYLLSGSDLHHVFYMLPSEGDVLLVSLILSTTGPLNVNNKYKWNLTCIWAPAVCTFNQINSF